MVRVIFEAEKGKKKQESLANRSRMVFINVNTLIYRYLNK